MQASSADFYCASLFSESCPQPAFAIPFMRLKARPWRRYSMGEEGEGKKADRKISNSSVQGRGRECFIIRSLQQHRKPLDIFSKRTKLTSVTHLYRNMTHAHTLSDRIGCNYLHQSPGIVLLHITVQ